MRRVVLQGTRDGDRVTARQFAVLIDRRHVVGPFSDEDEAAQFAAFATVEIDPATVVPLMSPAGQLLGWRESMLSKEGSDGHPF